MESHVRILGVLYLVWHGLSLLACVVILIAAVAVGGFIAAESGSDDEAAVGALIGGIGLVVSCIMLVLSLPGLLAGYGLLTYRRWGRILAVIIGALNLLSFPLGTALGVYTLIILLKPEADRLFS